jgi:hypothetical protein
LVHFAAPDDVFTLKQFVYLFALPALMHFAAPDDGFTFKQFILSSVFFGRSRSDDAC